MSHVNLLCWEVLSFCVFLIAVTFEDFPSNDTRVQTFLEALNNFTSGEQPQAFPYSSCAVGWARGQGTHCPAPR